MRFYATAAAAQQAGFRACLRCRPDATPGSPEWNVRADVVARAMRLIRDGVVDREGVEGLAGRLGYSTRQLNRLITAEVGHRGHSPWPGPSAARRRGSCWRRPTSGRPRGLRRRLLQRAPVQRHRAPDLRRHAERPAGTGGADGAGSAHPAGAGHPGHPAAAALPATLQPRVGARLPRPACPARRRVARRRVLHAQPAPPPRARRRDAARAGGDAARRRPGLRGGRARPLGPARPAHRGGPLPPAARPRRRPRRHLGGAARRPARGRPGAARSRAPRAGRRRRFRARRARRHRPAGLGPRGAHRRRAARAGGRRRPPRARRRGHPPLPHPGRAGGAGRARPGRLPHAGRPAARPGGAGPSRWTPATW